MTREGSKAIEEIRPGDYVLAAPEDDPDATPSLRLVEAVFQTFSPLMELRVEGRTILTTAEHPFWVVGKGWTDAQELKAGDLLRTEDGRWLAIEEVGRPRDPAPVYNMRVADCHTYFVGCKEWGFSVWAHNANCWNEFLGATKLDPKAGKAVYSANASWTSPKGLAYAADGVPGGRVNHILAHGYSNPTKPLHSVFVGNPRNILKKVDEAWAKVISGSVAGILQTNGNMVYTVPMGRKVGTAGETAIKIVVRAGTNRIVTAFPFL